VEQHAARTRVDPALDLGDGLLDVPERGRQHREEPLRVGGAPFQQEVVVRGDARQLQLGVVEAQEVSLPNPPTFG